MAELLLPGTPAPDFEARNQDGDIVRLRDFAGRPVVLYFYPADDTPGCTREACAFRDDFRAFEEKGAVVLGVSTQDEASHRAFRAKHRLEFDLLVDTDRELSRAYHALGLLGTAKRMTYVIGPDGRIRASFKTLDPGRHSEEALGILTRMQREGA